MQLHLWNSNSISSSPVAPRRLSCQKRSANVSKRETRAKGNDVISYVISANQHFASIFRCRYSNSRDVVASSPSFSRHAASVPRRACSQATQERFCILPRFESESLTQKRPIRILHILLAETLNNFSKFRPYVQYQGRFLIKPVATMMCFNNLLKSQQSQVCS